MSSSKAADAGSTLGSSMKRKRGLQELHEAIETIPKERKAAYLEAIEKAPYLFEHESDPSKFLQACDYNIWMAAQRMALYWEERRALFGPDRAFLPMTLTGDGAMTKEDIQQLQAGFPSLLPGRTTSGQRVVYLDRRQWLSTSTTETRLRGLFYMAEVLSQDEMCRTVGYLGLVFLVTPRISELDPRFLARGASLACNAFPVKLARYHLLNCPPKQTAKKFSINDFIALYVGTLGKSMAGMTDVHSEREEGHILRFLRHELGLSPASIPQDLGGSWDFIQAISWCRTQAIRERQTYKWTLHAAKRSKSGTAPTQKKTKEERASKRRATNAMHSRLKRERRRQELEKIHEERHALEREHESLRAEKVRLEELITQARKMVDTVESYSSTDSSCLQEHPSDQHTTILDHPHRPYDPQANTHVSIPSSNQFGLPNQVGDNHQQLLQAMCEGRHQRAQANQQGWTFDNRDYNISHAQRHQLSNLSSTQRVLTGLAGGRPFASFAAFSKQVQDQIPFDRAQFVPPEKANSEGSYLGLPPTTQQIAWQQQQHQQHQQNSFRGSCNPQNMIAAHGVGVDTYNAQSLPATHHHHPQGLPQAPMLEKNYKLSPSMTSLAIAALQLPDRQREELTRMILFKNTINNLGRNTEI